MTAPLLAPDAKMSTPPGWKKEPVPVQHDPEPFLHVIALCMAPILFAVAGLGLFVLAVALTQ